MLNTRTFARPAIAITLFLTPAACSSGPQAATQTVTATTTASGSTVAASPINGSWRMTTLQVTADGTRQTVPYTGQVTFTPSGTMLVQAMNPDAQAPDTAYTVGGYEAFYGPVTIDEAAGSLVVEVESAVVRDLIGQRLSRNYEVSGDTLVLTPTDASEGWRVSYERQ